jgi:hypothetical protein
VVVDDENMLLDGEEVEQRRDEVEQCKDDKSNIQVLYYSGGCRHIALSH